MCASVSACLRVCGCTLCLCAFVEGRGWHQVSVFVFDVLRQCLPQNPGLTDPAGLASQLAPEPRPHPLSTGTSGVPPCPPGFLCGCWGSRLGLSRLQWWALYPLRFLLIYFWVKVSLWSPGCPPKHAPPASVTWGRGSDYIFSGTCLVGECLNANQFRRNSHGQHCNLPHSIGKGREISLGRKAHVKLWAAPLCNPGGPWTSCSPPASAFQVLELEAGATMPALKGDFFQVFLRLTTMFKFFFFCLYIKQLGSCEMNHEN